MILLAKRLDVSKNDNGVSKKQRLWTVFVSFSKRFRWQKKKKKKKIGAATVTTRHAVRRKISRLYSFITVNKLAELFRNIRFPHIFSKSVNEVTIEFWFRYTVLQKFLQANMIFSTNQLCRR